ncbi:MAG: hypothetical protein LBR90_04720 [Elusimicrobiota bacterium]|jgi:outer membrane murein-binding lipoprotein Lpp|nr:hypothetical protein [Elusimicrobiota bacterium]
MQQLSYAQTPSPRPPDITKLSALLRNLIFILTAAVSFSLWLSSTITTPKRINKLESSLSALAQKQSVMEVQTALIRDDLKEIKNVLLNRKEK